jgi:THO complex subunit 4
VGPVKEEDTFIVYNNKGDSRGMAIVTFQREADAYAARTKYNGKLIDGRTYVGPFIRIQWYR